MDAPSELELKNTDTVVDLLSSIDDISYKSIQDREDIMEITGPEGVTCILDVEETMVCISTEICNLPEDQGKKQQILEFLLNENYQAIHGRFAISNGKIFVKENLEVKNLDGNELEAALGWVLILVSKSVEEIEKIIG